MRRFFLTAVVAASFIVAPAAQANPLDEVVKTVKCVGDALAGNTCHG